MCFVYVYSCICVCTRVLLSPLHTLPHWQLGKTWHWGKMERGMEEIERWKRGKGREREVFGCSALAHSRWVGRGEGAMEGRTKWTSPGDRMCFHVLLSFTCSPNSDWLAGLRTYRPARHAKTITKHQVPPHLSPALELYWLGVTKECFFFFLKIKYVAHGCYGDHLLSLYFMDRVMHTTHIFIILVVWHLLPNHFKCIATKISKVVGMDSTKVMWTVGWKLY